MSESINEMSDVLKIKNEIDGRLPHFDSRNIAVDLIKTCSEDNLAYAYEERLANFEKSYMQKAEMYINENVIAQKHYSELIQSFEYQLQEIKEQALEFVNNEKWSEVLNLVAEKSELDRQESMYSYKEEESDTCKKIMKLPESLTVIAIGVAILCLGIGICGVTKNVSDMAAYGVVWMLPGIIALGYVIIRLYYKSISEKAKRDNKKINKEKSDINVRRDRINDQIWELLGEIEDDINR